MLRSAAVLLKARRVSVSCLCFFGQYSSVLQCACRSLEHAKELVILYVIFSCVTTVKMGEILTMVFVCDWGLCMLKMSASVFGNTCDFIYIAGSAVVFLFITFMIWNWQEKD